MNDNIPTQLFQLWTQTHSLMLFLEKAEATHNKGGPNQHVNVTFVAASVTPLILASRNRTPRRQNVATATNLVTPVMFATLSLGTLLDIRNIQVTHVSLTTNIPPVAAQPLQVEVR